MNNIEIDREFLWNIWQVILTVDFDHRDEKYIEVSKEIKKLLNETKEEPK